MMNEMYLSARKVAREQVPGRVYRHINVFEIRGRGICSVLISIK